jgi:hypothetical protein
MSRTWMRCVRWPIRSPPSCNQNVTRGEGPSRDFRLSARLGRYPIPRPRRLSKKSPHDVRSSRPKRRTQPCCPARRPRTPALPGSAGRSRQLCAGQLRGRRVHLGRWCDRVPSIPRQSDPQPQRRLAAPSALPRGALYARQVLFLTRAVPFLPAAGSRPPSSGADLSAAIYATLCKSVLPESHRLSKLGGHGSIAQQSDNGIFGTRVPSR